MESNLSK